MSCTAKFKKPGLRIAAVACSAFWHSFCGVGEAGRPTLPILHLLDTSSAAESPRVPNTHANTGCMPHSSYWPAKLLWLERNRAAEFQATRRWLSFPEYLFEKLFGRARVSTSMASGTGLWNQRENDYDAETLAALPVRRDQLADPASMDEPERELLPAYRDMWPAFDGIPWFPALGDGAANHIGSGCARPDQFSLMVGTTGAMRVLVPTIADGIPAGLWCYRLDRRRLIMGGALSNGGDVYAWLKRTLAFPKDVEARLEAATPGAHGLIVLPFLAGERSPYWRADLRGAIAGLSLATEPFDILHASLESISLRFREIYNLLVQERGRSRGSDRLGRRAVTFAGLDADHGGYAGACRDGLHRTGALQPRRGIARAGASGRHPRSGCATRVHGRDFFTASAMGTALCAVCWRTSTSYTTNFSEP